MLELVFLVLMGSGVAALAKKRGVTAWPFVLCMVVGYFLGMVVGTLLFGLGPNLVIAVAMAGLVYVVLYFFAGGGRRTTETWQCPNCHLFNDPDTIFCGCGYELPVTK